MSASTEYKSTGTVVLHFKSVLITNSRLLGYFVTNWTEKMDVFPYCLQRRTKIRTDTSKKCKVVHPSVTYEVS